MIEKVYTIVIVDDEPEIASILEVFLSKRGFKTAVFNDGAEALSYVKEGSAVDLMVLDIKMPGVSGIDVLKNLREAKITFPVVILSGSIGVQDNIDVLRELGYDEKDILDKPIDLNQLLEAVKKGLSIDS